MWARCRPRCCGRVPVVAWSHAASTVLQCGRHRGAQSHIHGSGRWTRRTLAMWHGRTHHVRRKLYRAGRARPTAASLHLSEAIAAVQVNTCHTSKSHAAAGPNAPQAVSGKLPAERTCAGLTLPPQPAGRQRFGPCESFHERQVLAAVARRIRERAMTQAARRWTVKA